LQLIDRRLLLINDLMAERQIVGARHGIRAHASLDEGRDELVRSYVNKNLTPFFDTAFVVAR
jgi:hypothetical protein